MNPCMKIKTLKYISNEINETKIKDIENKQSKSMKKISSYQPNENT